MKKKLISLIVTCFNEEENIEEMYRRIVTVCKTLPVFDYEILFIDNDSTDSSAKIYKNLARKNHKVKVVYMSRNFGSPQPSFLAGIEYSSGDLIFLLHGDIQDPPELLPKFIAEWQKGYDVVYGVRTKRQGYGKMWNFFYKAFYFLLNHFAYIQIPPDAGDFSLITRRVANELLAIPEFNYYLRCLRAFVGFRQIGLPYIRSAREHGQTNENIFTSIFWAKQLILNFSFKPLQYLAYLGTGVTLLAIIFLLINIYWGIFYHRATPGLTTLTVVVLFLGGVQLISLSIIAEYISTIFLEVKRRPKYIVRETLNISKRLPKHNLT